jgi:hypothetical protein
MQRVGPAAVGLAQGREARGILEGVTGHHQSAVVYGLTGFQQVERAQVIHCYELVRGRWATRHNGRRREMKYVGWLYSSKDSAQTVPIFQKRHMPLDVRQHITQTPKIGLRTAEQVDTTSCTDQTPYEM